MTADLAAEVVAQWREADAQLTAACETSFRVFFSEAWSQFDPSPFRPNWHIDAICDHLEAVTRGYIQNLVINIPPRHTKTSITAIAWPAWEWGPAKRPERRSLFTSYGTSRALDAAVKSRRLMQTRWYRQRWGDVFKFSSDQNVKSRFENNRGGVRFSSSFESGVTGEGGDLFVVDDPLQLDDDENIEKIKHVNDEWDGTISSRLNDPATANRVIIMQRLNENDLSGYVVEQATRLHQSWTHLFLPAEFEQARRCRVFIRGIQFFADPRQHDGELLNRLRFDQHALADLKVITGSYRYAGRYQQRPAPAKGGIFERQWWRTWSILPPRMDEWMQSWDLTFGSKSDDASYVVGQLWAKLGAFRYLVDQVRAKMTFPETLKAVEAFTDKYPIARLKLVERKANGQAVIDSLQGRIAGVVPVDVTEDKAARARAVSPDVESGCVYLPPPQVRGWTMSSGLRLVEGVTSVASDVIAETATFPRGTYTDITDALTQALRRWHVGADDSPVAVIRANQ